jgi:hypothetical protein
LFAAWQVFNPPCKTAGTAKAPIVAHPRNFLLPMPGLLAENSPSIPHVKDQQKMYLAGAFPFLN